MQWGSPGFASSRPLKDRPRSGSTHNWSTWDHQVRSGLTMRRATAHGWEVSVLKQGSQMLWNRRLGVLDS